MAGDLTVAGVARAAGVPTAVAEDALRSAAADGFLDDELRPTGAAVELIDELDPERVAQVHAAEALHLLRSGSEHLDEALEHARAAPQVDQSELSQLAAASGRLAQAAGDHVTAALLLRIAVELNQDTDGVRARLLFDLAAARNSCGHSDEARDILSDVVTLAEVAGDADLLVDAAIRSAFPPDWRAGDRRTAALLDRAERLAPGRRTAAILGARAMVEMRIPVSALSEQQFAWVTRAEVAQPLSERALELTEGRTDDDRLVALASWRSTHRGPRWLPQRLDVSHQAVDLAQRLLNHDRLVDASAALAVDSLEAGDRPGYQRAVATLRWAAETDGDPRLRWWAETIGTGAALLDGDIDAAARHRATADEIGERFALPGWVAAEMLFAAEVVFAVDDTEEMLKFLAPSDHPMLDSPIARSSVALMAARVGQPERCASELRVAERALDEESSYLLCVTLLARAAVGIDDHEMMERLTRLLAPWRGRVAVDASGWWCLGPVDLTLAEIATARGDEAAPALLASARVLAAATGDVRSEARVAAVGSDSGGRTGSTTASRIDGIGELTERELAVLALIAQGMTNAAIGAALSYSPSTIRADTVSIYRKLDVRGRAEAAAVAVTAGLVSPT